MHTRFSTDVRIHTLRRELRILMWHWNGNPVATAAAVRFSIEIHVDQPNVCVCVQRSVVWFWQTQKGSGDAFEMANLFPFFPVPATLFSVIIQNKFDCRSEWIKIEVDGCVILDTIKYLFLTTVYDIRTQRVLSRRQSSMWCWWWCTLWLQFQVPSYRYVCIVIIVQHARASVQIQLPIHYTQSQHIGSLNAELQPTADAHMATIQSSDKCCFFFFFLCAFRTALKWFGAIFVISGTIYSLLFCSIQLFFNFDIHFLIYFLYLKCMNSLCFGSLTIGGNFLGVAQFPCYNSPSVSLVCKSECPEIWLSNYSIVQLQNSTL